MLDSTRLRPQCNTKEDVSNFQMPRAFEMPCSFFSPPVCLFPSAGLYIRNPLFGGGLSNIAVGPKLIVAEMPLEVNRTAVKLKIKGQTEHNCTEHQWSKTLTPHGAEPCVDNDGATKPTRTFHGGRWSALGPDRQTKTWTLFITVLKSAMTELTLRRFL